MKKLIAFVIAAMMVLSLIPAMAFTASAATTYKSYKDSVGNVDYPEPSSDFWSVWRDAGDYNIEEGDTYSPAAGYEYTPEGFKVIGPDFTDLTPKVQVQSSQPVDLKEGFYIKVRIDEFSYKGESGKEDEWISFHVTDTPFVMQGNTEWNNSWCCLIRGEGAGKEAGVESWNTVQKTDSVAGGFNHQGTVNTTPALENGCEIYEFEVTPDGTIKVNGTAVAGAANVAKHVATFEQTWVGITLHSGQKSGVGSLTILAQGTSAANATTPEGDDSRDPEDNIASFAPIADSNTIEPNKPALLFDANKTSFKKDPTGSSITLTPTGSMGYHCVSSAATPYFVWSIDKDLSYEAADFPVFVMMLKDFMGDDGGVYYCSGDVLSANDSYTANWSMWDDNARYYGADEEYTYIVLDMSNLEEEVDGEMVKKWSGRINSIRPHFATDPNDPDQIEWDINFMGFFRSVEEAHAYGEWYVENTLGIDPDETKAPEDDETKAPDETNAGDDESTADTSAESKDESTADTKAETKDESTADTKAETKAETEAPVNTGCASVVGFGAVAVLAAAAAAVVLKKKD